MARMSGITIKVPDAVVRRLRDQARASGRSVSALIRERIQAPPAEADSVHALVGDLAGSLAGSRQPATNQRRKFRRS
jgi:predicted transcriptional regulator